MTAVESRLAAILAEHGMTARSYGWVCDCGITVTESPRRVEALPLHAAHQAAVIAGADDLAVVDLSGAKYDYAPGYRNPSGSIVRPIGQPSTEGAARKKLASLANHGTYGFNGERPALLIRRKRWQWEEVPRDDG